MTATEIIKETVEFYSEDINRRAVVFWSTGGGSNCVYNTADGRHCAVGRCFTPEVKALGDDFHSNDGIAVGELKGLDFLLEEKYQGHPISLWQDLQHLHDGSGYWRSGGLTESGEAFLNNLLLKYEDN